jgi:hypothetical protein
MGTVRLYINGVLEGQRDAPIDVTSSGPVRIGANRLNNAAADASPVFPFKGSIREVRVWNTARSSQDIADNLSRCISRGARGLVAHYRFAEGSGDVLRDATGNRNDAVLRNGPVWVGAPPLCLQN